MKKIQSLSQLEKEKRKLKLKMEVSKREFAHSFETTQSDTKRFLLHKVIIPAGVVGAAGLGVSKVIAANKKKKQTQYFTETTTERSENTKKSSFANWQGLIMKLLPIGIQLFQSYIIKEEINNEDT